MAAAAAAAVDEAASEAADVAVARHRRQQQQQERRRSGGGRSIGSIVAPSCPSITMLNIKDMTSNATTIRKSSQSIGRYCFHRLAVQLLSLSIQLMATLMMLGWVIGVVDDVDSGHFVPVRWQCGTDGLDGVA